MSHQLMSPHSDAGAEAAGGRVGQVADAALQRVADASVWVIFRLSGVRS